MGGGSLFSYILGLQIETQFCPGKINGNPPEAGKLSFESEHKVEFFCAENVEGWFFDIYIQGSKKVQL